MKVPLQQTEALTEDKNEETVQITFSRSLAIRERRKIEQVLEMSIEARETFFHFLRWERLDYLNVKKEKIPPQPNK